MTTDRDWDYSFDEDIDFIVVDSGIFNTYLEDHPEIRITDLLNGGYKIVSIKLSELNHIIDEFGYNYIDYPIVFGLLDSIESVPERVFQLREQNEFNLTGNGTLIAVIDTGIDFTLDVFKHPNGETKIAAIYDQSIPSKEESKYPGIEFSREQIDAALKSDTPYDIVPHIDESGHGTFLASVAAGSEVDDFSGVAPGSEIIAVKLRKAGNFYREKYLIPDDVKEIFESSDIMLAIEYVVEKAAELQKPVSIFLAVGTNLTAHKGFSLLEDYIRNISKQPGVCVTIGAGNEAIAQKHFLGKIPQSNETVDLNINVTESPTDIYLSIHNNPPDRISLSITSPNGETVGKIPSSSNTTFSAKLISDETAVIVEYIFPTKGAGTQNSVVKLLNAVKGVWNIKLFGDIIIDGDIHAWLPMTGMGASGTTFSQSNANFTVVVPGTSLNAITVGAYDSICNTLYKKSSWGPSLNLTALPDFVAPGVNIPGMFPDGYGIMSGTGSASAYTAGICAQLLEWGVVRKNEQAISTLQIKAYLIRGCLRDANVDYPNPQWGYGRVNLFNTFRIMRSMF